MKKRLIIFIVVNLMFLFLTSCAMTTKTTYGEEIITNGDIEMQISSYNTIGSLYSLKNNLSMSIKVVNHNPKPYTFEIREATVIRETNNAEYSASFNAKTILECDMPKSLYFGADLPTAITEDNYYLKIKEKSAIYIFYLYEKPQNNQVDISIKYKVDGRIVKEENISAGKLLPQLKEYLNEDRTRYVDTWTINKETIDEKTIVNEDVIVEANSKNIFVINSNSSYYIVISGINYIPKDGIIVIPSEINGKAVSISSLGYEDDLKKLYFPLVFHVQGSLYLSLCDSLETIYYEGTEEQLNAIFQGKVLNRSGNTEIVYNTSYNG